jgi:hypothetical protein
LIQLWAEQKTSFTGGKRMEKKTWEKPELAKLDAMLDTLFTGGLTDTFGTGS